MPVSEADYWTISPFSCEKKSVRFRRFFSTRLPVLTAIAFLFCISFPGCRTDRIGRRRVITEDLIPGYGEAQIEKRRPLGAPE